MAEINDFGEKIGGARKDVWKVRGIVAGDLTEMNAMERKSNIKKENIWIRPDWTKVIADGVPQSVAYWQNLMRQSLPPRPPADDEFTQDNYVKIVGEIRDAVMSVRNPEQINNFYKNFMRSKYIASDSRSYYVSIVPEANNIITNKVLRAAQSNHQKMQREAKKKLFGISKDEKTYVATKNRLSVHKYDGDDVTLGMDERYGEDPVLTIKSGFGRTFFYLRPNNEFKDIASWEKDTFFVMDENKRCPLKINLATRQEAMDFVESYARDAQKAADELAAGKGEGSASKRKGAFTPPQLRHVKRTGPDYRKGRHAEGKMFLEDLEFRGGEFGNWLNNDDRQTSLDMAYDALHDLSRYLQIQPGDVSLGKSLAIAFGARGRGGSGAGAAHYEPDRQVINLTKMSGAGCLAHEWGHALDHAIGISCGGNGLASEFTSKRSLPKSYQDLLSSFKYKTVMAEPSDLREEYAPKIKSARRNLERWIDSVKPSGLPEDLEQTWNNAAKQILDSVSSFSGIEYLNWDRKSGIQTKPEVEILSEIRKLATNHVIPRDTKRQIAMWAVEVAKYEAQAKETEPVERTVKTEFYKGSLEFDKAYSRHGHGYWQSDCEMFARAFDCYIADKIREAGHQSDYLSGHSDAFVLPGEDGNTIAAFPRGEEREQINAKFDRLLAELKERGILHDYVESLEMTTPEQPDTAREAPANHRTLEIDIPSKPEHYKQLSFEDVLFTPESHMSQPAQKDTQSRDLLR